MVNIHTDQAELLIEHFEELRGDGHDAELEASETPIGCRWAASG